MDAAEYKHLVLDLIFLKFVSDTLATLRDTLLPRLISGQLRLPKAEAIIEEAIA